MDPSSSSSPRGAGVTPWRRALEESALERDRVHEEGSDDLRTRAAAERARQLTNRRRWRRAFDHATGQAASESPRGLAQCMKRCVPEAAAERCVPDASSTVKVKPPYNGQKRLTAIAYDEAVTEETPDGRWFTPRSGWPNVRPAYAGGRPTNLMVTDEHVPEFFIPPKLALGTCRSHCPLDPPPAGQGEAAA